MLLALIKRQTLVYPVLSALLLVLSIFYCQPVLGAICLVPLVYSLKKASLKAFVFNTGLFSLVYSSFLFFWMLAASVQFTGSVLYGVFGALFSLLLFSGLFTVVFFIWRKLIGNSFSWAGILVLGSLFALFEFVCDNIFKTLPWYSFHFGNPFIGSVYSIQLAEFGGIYVLTFLLFLINGGIAYALTDKKQLKFTATIILAFLIVNVFLFNFRTKVYSPKTQIKINLLNANIPASTNWQQDGNAIVPKIISLSEQASFEDADFNVWTESVVPWTYQKNDDFLNAILTNSKKSKVINLIGMNTDFAENKVLNSVYAIKADGSVLGRYDKVHPLTFMERPFKSSSTIQFGNNGYQVEAGNAAKPLNVGKSKIGVYICNEATIASAVGELVISGADFLVNISNDAWFKDTYIARHHFYYNRLRAVENRRDIAVNSNCGYSGKAIANGEILMMAQSDQPGLNQVTLQPSQFKALYTHFPNAFIIIITLLTTTIILFKKS